jgi:hypothetical protein
MKEGQMSIDVMYVTCLGRKNFELFKMIQIFHVEMKCQICE